MVVFVLALFGSGLATAAAPTLSATAGLDFPTDQPWAGLELAVHPTHQQGVGFAGRLAPGWGFGDGQPLVLVEAGALAVVPNDEAIVRLGLVGRAMLLRAEYSLPAGMSAGELEWGVVPGAMAVLEFEWVGKTTVTVGGRAGAGSAAYDTYCGDDADPSCFTWSPSFIGGFYGRLRLPNRFAAELLLGPTAHVSLGIAL